MVEKLGDACFRIDLPGHYADAWKAHRTIMAAEMAHNLGAFADRGGEMISKVLRDLVAEGRIGATEYLEALDEARAMRAAIAELFQQHCTAIIAPAARGGAPKGERPAIRSFARSGACRRARLSLPLLTTRMACRLVFNSLEPRDDARLLRTAHWLVSKLVGA